MGLTWWFRDALGHGLIVAALTIVPFAALWLGVSVLLPHRDAPWRALVPGAVFVGIGVPVMHGMIVAFLVPQLQKGKELYGALGAATALIFFIYLVSLIVVLAAVLNSALYDELLDRRDRVADGSGDTPG